MRILLDTRIGLWALMDDRRLGAAARGLIIDPDNAVFVSAASVLEFAIKWHLVTHDRMLAGYSATVRRH